MHYPPNAIRGRGDIRIFIGQLSDITEYLNILIRTVGPGGAARTARATAAAVGPGAVGGAWGGGPPAP